MFQGFELSWDGSSTGCGGSLTAPDGDIISPNYPQVFKKDYKESKNWESCFL